VDTRLGAGGKLIVVKLSLQALLEMAGNPQQYGSPQ
jgi:hypothetical protein